MKDFIVHSLSTAPEKSKPLLEDSIQAFGSIPNLHGVLAASPNTLEGYKALHNLFQNSSFNAEELTVVWQTINLFHECHYCVPAHTAIAHMMKVSPELIEALKKESAMPSKKLQVLYDTTLSLVKHRGNISQELKNTFEEAGYTNAQLLDIILAIAQKTISNYANHVAQTPLDDNLKRFV